MDVMRYGMINFVRCTGRPRICWYFHCSLSALLFPSLNPVLLQWPTLPFQYLFSPPLSISQLLLPFHPWYFC